MGIISRDDLEQIKSYLLKLVNSSLAVRAYDTVSPFLSAPSLRGMWKPESGYIGAGATAIVADLSGQGRDLTIGGTVTFAKLQSGIFAEVPYASIAAGAHYLERADETALAMLTGFTAVGWFNFTDVNNAANQYIFGQSDSNKISTGWQWGVWNRGSYPSGDHRILLSCPNGTTDVTLDGSTPLVNNTWYFVAARFTSAAEMALFVGNASGIVKDIRTTGVPTTLNNSAYAFRIFRSGDGGMQLQGGKCSLIGLYASALSDETIRAMFHSTRGYFGA